MIGTHGDVQRFFMRLAIAGASGEKLGEDAVVQLGADVRAGVTALAVITGNTYREVADRIFAGGPGDAEWPQIVEELNLDQPYQGAHITSSAERFIGSLADERHLIDEQELVHFMDGDGGARCGKEGRFVERAVASNEAVAWCYYCITGERWT